VTLGNFLFHLRSRHVVGFQNARITGQADADETGILHDVENVSERTRGVVRPEPGADRPFDIPIRRQAVCGKSHPCRERAQENASINRHHCGKLREVIAYFCILLSSIAYPKPGVEDSSMRPSRTSISGAMISSWNQRLLASTSVG